MNLPGKLFIIPTPIGNLEDMTFRAVRMLKEADLILAEDTRVSSKLLHHYGISNKLASFHKFNEHKTVGEFRDKIRSGLRVALISDAGTPGISDPGFLLVRSCLEDHLEVECLPGATALIPALVNSGFPSDRFIFEGFLPQKKGRRKRLLELETESRTMIFYESPFRLTRFLAELADIFTSNRRCCVCRELSKIHEENVRGTIAEVRLRFEEHPPRGEIVVIVEGKSKNEEPLLPASSQKDQNMLPDR